MPILEPCPEMAAIRNLLPNSPPPHVGMIVRDFDRAMEVYGTVFGCRWAPPIKTHHELLGPRAAQAELRVTFSVGKPNIELIEHRDGTIWSAVESVLHHLGFWVDDLESAHTILTNAGLAFQASGRRAGSRRIAYAFYSLDGLLIEIGDRRYEPYLQSWVGGFRE